MGTDRPGQRAPRALGGTFLAGARSRLLPASVPFRYFGAAVAFHVAAWAALLAGAVQWPQHAGGPGWVLAALHLLTLGVLVMTAIGASLQLLPVATRRPVLSAALPGWLWWAYVPGVAVLTLGMGVVDVAWMLAGAALVIPSLAVFGLLLALNLRGAKGMPGVVLHGWGAIVALAVVLASAAALLALWAGVPLVDRDLAHAWHVLAGPFGFMGLLALGLAYILVPMFALADVPAAALQLRSGAAVLAALLLAALAGAGIAPAALRLAALAAGATGVALHLQMMRRALKGGMRRELGGSFTLVKSGWGALVLGLLLAAPLAVLPAAPALRSGFGLVVVVGWLLGFLMGMLQRILPFLAAMHAAQGRRRPPTPSALTLERPLAVHRVCHFAALALLALALPAGSVLLAQIGAAAGLAGALGFAVFHAVLLRRWHALAPGGGVDAPQAPPH